MPPSHKLQTGAIEIGFGGECVSLDARGVIYLPERRVLAVADLHLEKGSRLAAAGGLMPRLDTYDTLTRLAACVADYRPQTVVCLGDSFHDARAGARLGEQDRAAIDALCAATQRWVWLSGNHDPHPPGGLGGETQDEFQIGAIRFSHIPAPHVAGAQIAGHLHPKAAFKARRQRVSGPCFLAGETTLILPAFGAFTGGLNPDHPAITAVFGATPPMRYLIYRGKLWPVA